MAVLKRNPRNGRTYTPRVEMTCEICGTTLWVCPCKIPRKRYCSRPCSFIGQGRRRRVWNKGLTKADHPSIQAMADAVHQSYIDDPTRSSGENHPMFGKKHSAASRQLMRINARGWAATPKQLAALAAGRGWDKGLTAKTNESLARRGTGVSKALRGRKNPAHAQHLKQFYLLHPDKHPNRILAQKGHVTTPEQRMQDGLTARGCTFEMQHPINGLYADFAFPEHKLVVEVDGEYWHTAERDAERDRRLMSLGWVVLHFTDRQVLKSLDACLDAITISLLGR